ncbi:Citrate transporter-like domain-containing protein [Plasmodiophora brassicae]|uniref:Citrate transporter-like domain-containing protein n=1 Tax=Plasmodiophora brassicae TaxID=37360 RepID=A0A0G4J8A7_PLABS|nr:hypothetical protein PBRA_003339 [Plasmodiophora brassicae]SPQ99691.1 unnamed protein product [Plasmodiophora brassicae]
MQPAVANVVLCLLAAGFTIVMTLRPAKKLHLNMATAPVISVALLLATGAVTLDNVVHAIVGDAMLAPYTVIILFLSLAYVCMSLNETGVLHTISRAVIDSAGTSYMRLFASVFVLCSLLTVFTSNDIVILTVTPIICHLCERKALDPGPLLFAQFLSTNTASAALLISNPTNIIIGVAFGLDFNSYIRVMIIPAMIATGTLFVFLVLYVRRDFRYQQHLLAQEDAPPRPFEDCHRPQHDRSITVVAVVVFLSTLLALVLSPWCQLDLWVICLVAAVVMVVADAVYVRRLSRVQAICKQLPWSIVPFVSGMFVIVGGLEANGFSKSAATALGTMFANANVFSATLVAMVVSVLACNLINNQPMSILAVSIMKQNEFRAALPDRLWSATVFAAIAGSNFGANLSMVGSLAGVMWTGMLRDQFKVVGAVTHLKMAAIGVFCMVPVVLMMSAAISFVV